MRRFLEVLQSTAVEGRDLAPADDGIFEFWRALGWRFQVRLATLSVSPRQTVGGSRDRQLLSLASKWAPLEALLFIYAGMN